MAHPSCQAQERQRIACQNPLQIPFRQVQIFQQSKRLSLIRPWRVGPEQDIAVRVIHDHYGLRAEAV